MENPASPRRGFIRRSLLSSMGLYAEGGSEGGMNKLISLNFGQADTSYRLNSLP